MFDRYNAFLRCKVREQWSGHDIANGINTFLRGLLELINLDETTVYFDLGSLKPKPFGERHSTDRNQKHLRFDTEVLPLRRLASNAYACFRLLQFFELCINLRLNATLPETSLQLFRYFFIFERHQAR